MIVTENSIELLITSGSANYESLVHKHFQKAALHRREAMRVSSGDLILSDPVVIAQLINEARPRSR